jgi:choice-of-anchor A domain-containing protein
MLRRSIALIAVGLSFQLFAPVKSSADLAAVLPELGDLQRWSVFTLGDGTGPDEFADTVSVQGDVGAAGVGDITLKGSAAIQGNLYYHSNGTLKMSPDATITGAQIHNQDSLLDNDAAAAIAASRHAASLKQHYFAPTSLELSRKQDFTVTGAPGQAVVLKLSSFVLTGNSTFTLQGTTTTTFIINVSKQFMLSDAAKVVLSGGVQWSNVLFNITGKGSAVSLSGNSSFAGILMANRRAIQVRDQASVDGELIANRVMLMKTGFRGAASVGHPPLTSP